MKKSLYAIFYVCLLCLLAGCGADQYAIEKQYWQAQRQAEKIAKNPHASPPRELERVVGALDNFIKKHPKDNLAIEADFNIARLYFVKEEYERGRARLKSIIDKYAKSHTICAEAVFLTGNSYEMQDKWDLALQQYKKIMQEYPQTLRGLDAPVYIARHFKIKQEAERMAAALQGAIAHYQSLINKYPDSPLAYDAYLLMAQCYMEIKDWQNAVGTLGTVIAKYKGKVNLDGVLMNMALIYSRELKDTAKAKVTLEQLLKEYPKSKLVKTAEFLLKEAKQE